MIPLIGFIVVVYAICRLAQSVIDPKFESAFTKLIPPEIRVIANAAIAAGGIVVICLLALLLLEKSQQSQLPRF